MSEFLRQLLPALDGPLKIVLQAVAVLVAWRIHQYVKNRQLADQLDTLQRYASNAVAETYQQFVKPLKDPGQQGVWTKSAAASAKRQATESVQQLAPQLIAALRTAGEDTNATIGQMIERGVVELNRRLVASGQQLPAPMSDPPPLPRITDSVPPHEASR